MKPENIIFDKIDRGAELTRDEIAAALDIEDQDALNGLYERAYKIKLERSGNVAYLRGLIEIGNICGKNCYYCGIRRDNKNAPRYQLTEDEIVKAAVWAWRRDYGSIVTQSGERSDPAYTAFIEKVLKRIATETNGELAVTLCFGEQSRETYQRWFDAGASRYLLRIESSDPTLYRRLHPEDHDFDIRKRCLGVLRDIGYQVGTGVLIGVPGQTSHNLADDILFYKREDIDMIGMGPYIVHEETPMAAMVKNYDPQRQLTLGLKMIAMTRIVLKDVNIASTTALQTLAPNGRELGLKAGANVVMPNITDTQYRDAYQLYKGKPGMDESSVESERNLIASIEAVGETVGLGKHGTSPHFLKRKNIA